VPQLSARPAVTRRFSLRSSGRTGCPSLLLHIRQSVRLSSPGKPELVETRQRPVVQPVGGSLLDDILLSVMMSAICELPAGKVHLALGPDSSRQVDQQRQLLRQRQVRYADTLHLQSTQWSRRQPVHHPTSRRHQLVAGNKHESYSLITSIDHYRCRNHLTQSSAS